MMMMMMVIISKCMDIGAKYEGVILSQMSLHNSVVWESDQP